MTAFKLAVPTMGEASLDSQRSGHFGHCDCFTLCTIEDGQITAVEAVQNPPHEEGGCLRPVKLLADAGADAIVAAGAFGFACLQLTFANNLLVPDEFLRRLFGVVAPPSPELALLLVALTTFFPITVALASGFRSVDPDAVDLMRTLGASRWQVFRFAKLPAAAASFFTGLRISVTYAVIGAVVAEWLGGFDGLGVYMTRVRKSYDYDSLFAAIVVVSAVSLALLGATKALERACMPWLRARRKGGE